MPSPAALMLRALDPLRPLLQSRPAQTWLKAQVARRVTGPHEAARVRYGSHVWGEAHNRGGQRRVARLQTANGYDVTVHGALMAVRRLLAYEGPGGYFTPTHLGERCVETLPGSSRITLESSRASRSVAAHRSHRLRMPGQGAATPWEEPWAQRRACLTRTIRSSWRRARDLDAAETAAALRREMPPFDYAAVLVFFRLRSTPDAFAARRSPHEFGDAPVYGCTHGRANSGPRWHVGGRRRRDRLPRP